MLAATAAPALDIGASERDVQIKTLEKNVDHAFLWGYLSANKGKVHYAPGGLRGIGVKIVRATGNVFKTNCRFYVVDSPKANAAASPGGNIFLYKGALDLGLDESQKAALIAHEVAHVARGHWLGRLRRQLESKLLVRYSAKVYGKNSAQVQALYKALENLEYNREEEHEADLIGAQLMVDAGYRPVALAELLRKVRRHQLKTQPELANVNPLLSSHPSIEERINRVEEIVASGRLRPRKKRLSKSGLGW